MRCLPSFLYLSNSCSIWYLVSVRFGPFTEMRMNLLILVWLRLVRRGVSVKFIAENPHSTPEVDSAVLKKWTWTTSYCIVWSCSSASRTPYAWIDIAAWLLIFVDLFIRWFLVKFSQLKLFLAPDLTRSSRHMYASSNSGKNSSDSIFWAIGSINLPANVDLLWWYLFRNNMVISQITRYCQLKMLLLKLKIHWKQK